MVLDKLSISYIIGWLLIIINLVLLCNELSSIHYIISIILIECIYYYISNLKYRENQYITQGIPIAKITWTQSWDNRVNNILSATSRPIINYQLMYQVTLNFIANYNHELYNNELYNNIYDSSINLNDIVVIGIKI